MTFSFFPRIVFQTSSQISGSIIVEEQFGQKLLKVGGITQSGWLVKNFWKKVLKILKKEKAVFKKVLVLGLGGGTVAPLINHYWPEAKTIGVELDPEVVKIGKDFFGLSHFKNLKTETADAFKWIKNQKVKFDLILVDLYLGKKFPEKGEQEVFFKDLKKNLNSKGVIVFNRLKTDETVIWETKLRKEFSSLEKIKATTNLLFLARSQG